MMDRFSGYISLHRKIIDWEWFRDPNTLSLFIYLLVSANYADSKFLGKKIRRGQVVTSLAGLAEKTGLSVQNVRTALRHLILTGEVTNVSCRQYRIITIAKYDEYQKLTNNPTDLLTNNQQTTNKRLTNSQQHHNNVNKVNNVNNVNKGVGAFAPPTPDQVNEFCQSKGFMIDIDRFMDYYASNGWMVGRNRMKDWRAAVRNWARRDKAGAAERRNDTLPAQDYHQRDYSGAQDDALARMMALGGELDV